MRAPRPVITAGIAVIAFIALSLTGVLAYGDWIIAKPINWIAGNVGSATTSARLGTQQFFCPNIPQISTLETKITELTAENTRLKLAQSENEALRAQLAFAARQPGRTLIAHIIGKTTNPYTSGFIIDRGSRDGVRENLPVLAKEGIIVAKISRVFSSTSEVTLINDSHSKLLATVPGKTNTSGIIAGNFGLGITMNQIPSSSGIQQGDVVVTSGLEPDIPAGLLIATVTGTTFEPADLFKTAQLQPLLDYQDVRIVSVLMP